MEMSKVDTMLRLHRHMYANHKKVDIWFEKT